MGNLGSLYSLWALSGRAEDGSFPQWPYNKETESKVTVSPSGHRALWPSFVEMGPLLSQAGTTPFSVSYNSSFGQGGGHMDFDSE